MDTGNHNSSQQKPLQEPIPGKLKNCQRFRVQSLRAKTQSKKTQMTHFCEFYLQEFFQVLIVSIREKSSHASSSRRGKGTILKQPDHCVLLNNAYSQKNLVQQSLIYLGERKCPTPAPSTLPHGVKEIPNSNPPQSSPTT